MCVRCKSCHGVRQEAEWQPAHPSRMGCRQVWCSSRWDVSTILRQEWDNLFHKSSWRLEEERSENLIILCISPFYRTKSLEQILTFYHQSFSSSPLSPGQALWSHKTRSVCREQRQEMITETMRPELRELASSFCTCWGSRGSGRWSRRQGRCPGRHGWWWSSHTGTKLCLQVPETEKTKKNTHHQRAGHKSCSATVGSEEQM